MNHCIDCEHWTLKGSGDMGKIGFANCAKEKKWVYMSRDSEVCDSFKEIEAEKVKARVVWLDKQKG